MALARTPDAGRRERRRAAHLDDALAGVEGQPHQAGPVDGHDLVSDVQPPGLLRRPSMHHAGDDDGGEDGAPPRLHDHQAQHLALLLLDVNLRGERERRTAVKTRAERLISFKATSQCNTTRYAKCKGKKYINIYFVFLFYLLLIIYCYCY